MSGRYRVTKIKADGIVFDSKMEYLRYKELRLLQKAGELRDLDVHPAYRILINGELICKVELDFRYVRADGALVIEDVKGHDNALSRLKRKLVEAQHGIKVTLVRHVR